MVRMKKLLVLFLSVVVMASCTQYAKVQKSMDYDYKYELAKAYYMEGEYSQASSLLEDVLAFMKGTIYAEESLYMLSMCYYNMKDYVTASHYFTTYYNTYPRVYMLKWLDSCLPVLSILILLTPVSTSRVPYVPLVRYRSSQSIILFRL